MTDMAVVAEPFRVGTCLSKSLAAFFKNFISFNVIGLIVMVPGVLLIVLLFGNTFVALMTYDPATTAVPPDMGEAFGIAFLGAFAVMIVLQYLLTGAIVYGALQHLDGHKPSIVASLMQGLRRIIPIILVAIITTVLVWIGLVLLIVPGIIIALMLCVAIPVVMVEGPGVLASLSRSRALTKGSRWRLLGLLLIAFIGTTVLSMIVSTVVSVALVFVGSTGPLISTGIDVAMQLFTTVFLAVVLAVAYHDLRVAKEGVSTAQLAAVFD